MGESWSKLSIPYAYFLLSYKNGASASGKLQRKVLVRGPIVKRPIGTKSLQEGGGE